MRLLALGGSLLLAGCAATEGSVGSADPLLGGAGPRTAVPAATTAQPRAVATPVLPAPATSTSPAALAAGAVQPLDASRELRIPGGRDKAAPAGEWKGAPGTEGGVALQRPEPVGPETMRPAEIKPASLVTPAGAGRAGGLEQGLAQLRARGAAFYRLETVDNGELRLTCSLPSRQNPNLLRTYEAHAADELTALRLVLDQIDREQR